MLLNGLKKIESKMARVRIVDIAEELGVSTATVSNVIHGKTKKISEETVRRVQQKLEEKEYIPSMAGILLAQNDSRIIGIVINNHEKYEGRALEDPFLSASISALSNEIEKEGYFLMIKTTTDLQEVKKFASMWNLAGMIIIGFCEQDYKNLRDVLRIPFIVYDGFFEDKGRVCNLTIDNFSGGYQVGKHLVETGHKKILCISDNDICMDHERYMGLKKAAEEKGAKVDFLLISMDYEERKKLYKERIEYIKEHTAVFAVSDIYAVEFMQSMLEQGLKIPQDLAIVGFDDTPLCKQIVPALSSVKQDFSARAKTALSYLRKLQNHEAEGDVIELPVTLMIRDSSRRN